MDNPFDHVSEYYDSMYVKPERYKMEAEALVSLTRKYLLSGGNRLLDIACGTGPHIPFLQEHFDVTGLDLSAEMLELARQKLPGVRFILADMTNFSINEKFDIVACLYGSIGMVGSLEKMRQAVHTFGDHLNPGGLLVLTPWSTTEEFEPSVVVDALKHPDIKLARMENVKRKTPDLVEIEFHHLIGKGGQVEYHCFQKDVGLFSEHAYVQAIEDAGLELVERYREKAIRFGAYIARKNLLTAGQ